MTKREFLSAAIVAPLQSNVFLQDNSGSSISYKIIPPRSEIAPAFISVENCDLEIRSSLSSTPNSQIFHVNYLYMTIAPHRDRITAQTRTTVLGLLYDTKLLDPNDANALAFGPNPGSRILPSGDYFVKTVAVNYQSSIYRIIGDLQFLVAGEQIAGLPEDRSAATIQVPIGQKVSVYAEGNARLEVGIIRPTIASLSNPLLPQPFRVA